MKKILPTALMLLCAPVLTLQAEEQPKGKPIAKIFTNFHTGFGPARHDRGFELERSYLGYEYQLNEGLTFTGVLDVGQSKQVDDMQRLAYLKNMMVTWKKQKLTLKAGLIPTIQFGQQEKFWDHRYIRKSFQDAYKFGNSADLGVSVAYNFNSWLSADALVANGEGYKKIQFNDGLLYGAGLTLRPLNGLLVRVYGGINERVGKAESDHYQLATFIGYRHEGFSVGAEYNFLRETHTEGDGKPWGLSFYSTVDLSKRMSLFGRYDQLFSDNATTARGEEQQATVGLELSLNRYLKLAPTFTYKNVKSKDRPEYYAGIYCYFGI